MSLFSFRIPCYDVPWFTDVICNRARDGKLGPEIENKMQELKSASSSTVTSARNLCSNYETLAKKVIEKLRRLAQSNRGAALIPDDDLDSMWNTVEILDQSSKASVASLLQCTYDLRLVSSEAEERYGKMNVAKRVRNWLTNHGHATRTGAAVGAGAQDSSMSFQFIRLLFLTHLCFS